MNLVRSVSGTWHIDARAAAVEDDQAITACLRLVRVGKRIDDWDESGWPGSRVCTECPWVPPCTCSFLYGPCRAHE